MTYYDAYCDVIIHLTEADVYNRATCNIGIETLKLCEEALLKQMEANGE